jgi:hypothetical protein
MSLAILAGIFEPDVLDNMEACGPVIQLLAGFLADFLALFATTGASTSLFIENVDLRYPRQVRRQFFATTRASRRGISAASGATGKSTRGTSSEALVKSNI